MRKGPATLGMGILIMGVRLVCGLTAAPALESVKRYAVVIGANNGGEGRDQLRYAVSDATSFRDVLEELGGVSNEDSLLLMNPNAETVFFEMGKLQARIESARREHGRIEMIFYYSGHSDETHLLLNKGRISYEDLREAINRLPADVRIAILDSCASGAFTRIKGGKKMPSFLLDESNAMQGYAFLTSSSATEASQESDLLKSSFFTHYLTSGLRGAADLNQDGRVTLNEAYQFAFDETLAETTQTLSGPQHPNYDIRMSGAGEVVMTDVRNGSSIMVLGPEIAGRLFIHDRNNLLIMELTKPGGRMISLGLDEGSYRVIMIREGRVFESRVSLKAGKDLTLTAEGFNASPLAYTTPRGDRTFRLRKEFLSRGFVGRPILNNVSMPTGAALYRGEFIVGLGPVSYGITDRVQIGSNMLLLLFQVFNANLKTALIRSESLNLSAGLDWQSFDLKVNGVDTGYTSFAPYVAVSPRLSEKTALHFCGRLAAFTGSVSVEKAERSRNIAGTSASAGLEIGLSNRKKLLAEFSYDLTFRALRTGAAVLFGWDTFRLKLGLEYFKPDHSVGSPALIAGLWWRFGR